MPLFVTSQLLPEEELSKATVVLVEPFVGPEASALGHSSNDLTSVSPSYFVLEFLEDCFWNRAEAMQTAVPTNRVILGTWPFSSDSLVPRQTARIGLRHIVLLWHIIFTFFSWNPSLLSSIIVYSSQRWKYDESTSQQYLLFPHPQDSRSSTYSIAFFQSKFFRSVV